MSKKFQNNYRGGWDDNMPFDDFNLEEVYYNYEIPHDRGHNYADDRYLSHQMPTHYADDRYLSHKVPAHYVDDRQLPHRTPAHYSDQRSGHYADKRHLTHQWPEHYSEERFLPHQMLEDYGDKRHLPHQTAEDYADKRHIAHHTPEHYADKRCFAHQTDGHYADNRRYFSHQMEERYADKKRYFSPQLEEHFSPQTEEHYADKKRYFSPQLEEHYADKKRYFSPQLEEHYADKKRYFPHRTKEHCANKKRYFPHQTTEHCADKKRYFAHQTKEHFADKRHFPRQIPEDCADKKGLPHQTLVDFGGKRHLSRQKSEDYSDKRYLAQQKAENYGDKRHLLHQMPKSKKSGHPGENVSCEARSIKHKKVPAESSNRKLGDDTGAKDHGFKVEEMSHEVPNFKHKKVPAESSKRKLGDDTGAKDCGFKVENVKNESPSFKNRKVPAEMSKRKLRDDTGAKSHGVKPEIGGATGGNSLKMNNGIRNPVKSSKPVVNAQVFTPAAAAAEGSTFEPKNHIDSQGEVTEAKEHHEVPNNGVDSNDERRSISTELHYSAGSNTQTEVVNSDFAANKIVIEPLSSAPSDAVGSSFEPLTEHGLHSEIEPQESEAVAYYESQHPTDETGIELLPSVLMEIDAHSESNVETETADGSSQDEVDLDVLSTESGTTKLPQDSVCLTCGDEGFQETLVYCKGCEDCALHRCKMQPLCGFPIRYCLDGPVIFTDEVIWFCEDCEEEVMGTDYHDSETIDLEKVEVDSSKECFTVADPQPIAV